MNRRSFFKLVGLTSISIPLIGVSSVAPLTSDSVRPMDLFQIFSPEGIKKRFGADRYVSTPVFKRDGITYCVKTYKLHLRATHEFIHTYFPTNRKRMCEVQYLAMKDIQHRLELNYIHCVRFYDIPETPLFELKDGPCYFAYVRGVGFPKQLFPL